MVGHDGDNLSSRVLHYASSLRGTRQYWMQTYSNGQQLGNTYNIFTHSYWPGLGKLINSQAGGQQQAVIENPAIADWFFSTELKGFLNCFM